MKNLYTKTRQQIAEEYGVSRRTLCRWLKKAGLVYGKGLLKPREIEQIYSKFGMPKNREKEEEN